MPCLFTLYKIASIYVIINSILIYRNVKINKFMNYCYIIIDFSLYTSYLFLSLKYFCDEMQKCLGSQHDYE